MEKLLDTLAGQPLALFVFAVVLALIFGVRYLGLWQGQNSSPAASASTASVAAVIVDPTALNRASVALEANNFAQTEANVIARQQVTATERLAKASEGLSRDIDKLTDEVIRSAAKMK